MAVNLKYNLVEYQNARNNINQLKTDIETNKSNMLTSLDDIKKDWTTEGGQAFFKSVDESWSDGIDNCITVLEDLISALDDAYTKYEGIEEEAKTRFSAYSL